MTAPVLEVKGLSKSFGGVKAIRDLSFQVHPHDILGLIGPNGSGKSTTVNTLAGVHAASAGEIVLDGAHVQTLPEYERVALGLARTFQTARLFPEFTVREQIALGGQVTRRSHPLSSVFAFGRRSAEDEAVAAHVEELLDMTGLRPVAETKTGAISSAQQRFLMIATALAARPKVVLLDEPAAGLVAHERKELGRLIREIRDSGVAVLVIEHHMGLIMEICTRIVVLNFGAKIAEGAPEEIRNDKAVIDAYLGEAA
ncbi:ABC transporter ATP-binding protein [Oceanicella actignis]|uniref:ABC transporter ATP-binding protein n=1 Tax=Oceanicella actignis TaxID=1189325 RepID=UPI0011E78AB9|nr:ABC transporter ATP-binding protein [Oceanicella actignis]TYO83955.1 amino acid/amide ABC transporter ATP-binding protein 1 (HAAT family) [Oceanicella actignis]